MAKLSLSFDSIDKLKEMKEKSSLPATQLEFYFIIPFFYIIIPLPTHLLIIYLTFFC